MPNALVQAAAEGLPSIHRRRLLMGLAAASATAAAMTAPDAAASAVVTSAQENPELVRLGDQWHAMADELVAARAALQQIVNEWSPKWPAAPEALVYNGWNTDNYERDLQGHAVQGGSPYSGSRGRCVRSVEDIAYDIRFAEGILRNKTFAHRKKVQRLTREQWEVKLAEDYELIGVARDYEAQCQRIRAASGVEAATKRYLEAEFALMELIKQVVSVSETSMIGIIIKAQVMARAHEIGNGYLTLFSVKDDKGKSVDIGVCLAQSILRIAGEQA
ncbi:hypothetical protein QTA58_00330 [Neorhizobium sp. CSC1952]|uniref:hypothetical protein n=1 Tax=Neorhizobium sp. CSC1952 TaxID=2978974 RepID=UPI0025A5C153|nr:hypothetical protein [Rhizobium sp. CSC1952]WJR67255.1 hypothetical protein QTA58_00330 [Rhizobium sp. CSC1952]